MFSTLLTRQPAPVRAGTITALVIDACGSPVLVTWPAQRNDIQAVADQLGCRDLDVIDAGPFEAYSCGSSTHLHESNPEAGHTLAAFVADSDAGTCAVWGAVLIVRRGEHAPASLSCNDVAGLLAARASYGREGA